VSLYRATAYKIIRESTERLSGYLMAAQEIESIIAEVEHSLAVEDMTMSLEEKENLRHVGRGELSFQELIAQYAEDARKVSEPNA